MNKLYQETSIAKIAEALRLKNDGGISNYYVAEMGDAVLNLPFGNIPLHHYEEAGRVVKRLLELKAACPNHLLFGTISDNHVDTTTPNAMASARHAVFALESVGAFAGCDFVANLGDNIVGTHIDDAAGAANSAYMEHASRYAMSSLTAFNLVGNHEKSNSTQKLFDLIGKYNTFDSYGRTQIRGYGYKDFASKKVRVIVLNTCDYWNGQGGNGMSYEQKDFLLRALDLSSKADPASWAIIVLSHIPLDFLGGDYNKGADLKAILKAYNNGESVSVAVNSSYANQTGEAGAVASYPTYSSGALVYNYAGKNAARVVNIHGHIHTNAYGKLKFIDDNTTLEIVRAATANSAYSQNKTTSYTENGDYSISAAEADKIKKTANSKKDTSATFYLFDLDKQVIYSVGYGADVDRVIPYKEAQIYSVSYALTDVTSSNNAPSAVEGTAFKTTLSVGKDFALSSVSVTMGGVDVTATAYADGIVSIASVTGNIVITATAIENYTPHWDIADRTQQVISAGASDTKSISRKNYYVGASSTGAIYGTGYITGLSVSGNNVTFTSSSKDVGIGLPYHLEAGATYTFSAKASASARLRWCYFNADGTYTGEQGYCPSGTDLTVQVNGPTDTSKWVMLIIDTNTVNTSITYTDVTLTKN